jgi:hypothetical protein
MSDVVISIRPDGNLVFLDNKVSSCFKDLGKVTTRRASHVEPNNALLRFVFHLLRTMSPIGDIGILASFTRKWPCLWRVNTAPVGGPVLPGRWYNRQAAIDAEVIWLNENLQ